MTLFAYDFEGRSYTTLSGAPQRARPVLKRLPTLLGEPGFTTLGLWMTPDVIDFRNLTAQDLPGTFLQAAGTAEAMTIEWRRADEDAVERLYTLGHGGSREDAPTVEIGFFGGTRNTRVYQDEVFAAEEAGDIFIHYYETQRVLATYTLRTLDLTWAKP